MKRLYGLIGIFLIILILVIVGSFVLNNKSTSNGMQIGIGGGPGNVSPTVGADTIKNRTSLTKILEEHVAVGIIHLQDVYDGKDTASSTSMMNKNTNDLISLAGNYTSDQSLLSDLRDIWTKHIQLYEQYTLALKSKDTLKAEQTKMALHSLAKDFGNTASKIFPNVPAGAAQSAFTDHVDLTLSIIDAYSKKDENTRITQAAKSTLQAASFATILIP